MSNGEGSVWRLRLLAIGLALMLWFGVAVGKREPIAERVVEVTVTYDTPPGFIILDPVENVRVRLRGKKSTIRGLNPYMVDAFVEIPNPQPGTREVLLGPENVSVPEGIEVVSIDPNLMRATLDREVSEMLTVEPRVTGEPPAGAVIGRALARPAQVLVRGPETRIRDAGPLTTTPVDLGGHALDFEERAAVISQDPLISIVEPAVVTVRVRVSVPAAAEEQDPETSP